jgi:hypothetical protein
MNKITYFYKVYNKDLKIQIIAFSLKIWTLK